MVQKLVRGKVALVPFAGITLLMVCMIPHNKEAKGQVACAIPGCPDHQCCGRILGQTGGCSVENCCGAGADICANTRSQIPIAFPKAQFGVKGTCIKVSDTLADWCTRWDCTGGAFCSQGTCVATGNPETVKKFPPVDTFVVCPLDLK